ncbi:MAG: BrnT family toxin [Acidobacteria bacterium]|nr:BrnT family toxin [Acidobacteriota bacterium]
MRFEWDKEKDLANQKKHGGIDFALAALVFDDPDAQIRKDRVVEGEQRWHAIGSVAGGVLLVVHVYREHHANANEETIRIISARAASQRECRVYFQ